jgi:hypothetical protein
MPWGLATIWWDLPDSGPFYSLSIDFSIDEELPDGTHLFIAPLGSGLLNEVRFYGGVQVGGLTPDGKNARLGLFSRWNERSQQAMRAAPGGYGISSGAEGDFVSVRQFVPWHRGRYTARLTVTDRASSPPGSWVQMTVSEAGSGRQWIVGSLLFPGRELKLGPSVAAFVELFGPPIRPEDVPKMTVAFGDLRVNGTPAAIRHAQVEYAADVPPYVEADKGPNGRVTLRVGEPHSRQGFPSSAGRGVHQSFDW